MIGRGRKRYAIQIAFGNNEILIYKMRAKLLVSVVHTFIDLLQLIKGRIQPPRMYFSLDLIKNVHINKCVWVHVVTKCSSLYSSNL